MGGLIQNTANVVARTVSLSKIPSEPSHSGTGKPAVGPPVGSVQQLGPPSAGTCGRPLLEAKHLPSNLPPGLPFRPTGKTVKVWTDMDVNYGSGATPI